MTGSSTAPSASDILWGRDLTGLRVFVTGASAGIGLETARVLAAHGAHVTGGVRNLEKGRTAARQAGIGTAGSFDLVEIDLDSLASVRRCADILHATGARFDLVIANAGCLSYRLERTIDGIERTLASNFLGHFVFINRLTPLIRDAGRVVLVSSNGHRFADVDLEDVNFERRRFSTLAAYGGAKTAEILFAVEFDSRHRDRGVRAVALNPGSVGTDLALSMPADVARDIYTTMLESGATPDSFTLMTLGQGAATSAWAGIVASADAVGARYCEDCAIAAISAQGPKGVKAYALDSDRAARLWKVAEGLAGEAFAD